MSTPPLGARYRHGLRKGGGDEEQVIEQLERDVAEVERTVVGEL